MVLHDFAVDHDHLARAGTGTRTTQILLDWEINISVFNQIIYVVYLKCQAKTNKKNSIIKI